MLKKLTDAQYEELREYASDRGMSLHGYTVTSGGVLLNNSLSTDVYGKTIAEIKKSIDSRTKPKS